MALPIALGIASLFFTGVSIIQQIQAAGDASDIAEENKEIQAADRRLAELRNRRQKVEQIRQGRIARATILNQAEQTGTSKSSGALGGAAAIQTQTASNVGFLNAVEQTSQEIFSRNQNISDLNRSQSQRMAFASITGTLGQTFSPALLPMFRELKN